MYLIDYRAELGELRDWLIDQIDGGEECRGRDSMISRYIEAVEWALIKTNLPSKVRTTG